MLVLTRSEIEGLLDLQTCVDAVEDAFRAQGEDKALEGSRRHVAAGTGGFHVAIGGTTRLLSVKVNAHFPPAQPGAPSRMGGAIYLGDAETGEPFAMLDSRAVTILRTAAATAVAIRHLARRNASRAVLVGGGRQARAQVEAITLSMAPTHLAVYDRHPERAAAVAEHARNLGVDAAPVDTIGPASREADVVVTATPAHEPILDVADVSEGVLVVALGADGPGKQELDPRILANAKVVVDIGEQCAASGELAGAIAAGLMTVDDVHAELGEVIAGRRPGRIDDAERIVFDSTGTGLQDAAAGAIVVEAARRAGRGVDIDLWA